MTNTTLIGPFTQVLTMDGLPIKGPIKDEQISIIEQAGIIIDGDLIQDVGVYDDLADKYSRIQMLKVEEETVALPGFIDSHTHICSAGSRANDYAMRIAGKSYLEIAKEGGGIWQTVQQTRNASQELLAKETLNKAEKLQFSGITTAEVKSGYGLNPENELKMLEVIKIVNEALTIDLISTCLAAHICPKDFKGTKEEYLNYNLTDLLPIVKKNKLSNRVDIFIEDGAFDAVEAKSYLLRAREMGFDLTIHGDQFTSAGSQIAVETNALSVDHLESTTNEGIQSLAKSDVVATVLPGASIGLGMQFAPARKLLDAGCSVAIGSDWNPGSAPMGDLLTQTSILSASEKLSNAESFAGITFRASKALNLNDRGILSFGKIADIIGFPCADYREILYQQGQLKPSLIIKKGVKIH